MFRSAVSKDAQKDLATLNKLVQKRPNLFADFYLAGGTALAIQLGHRISYDLDFFTQKSYEPEALLASLKELPEYSNLITEITIKPGTLLLKAYTNLSFFEYKYPLVAPLVENALGYPCLKLASVADIVLMKVTAISSRGLKKDFIDLYFALKYLGWDKETLMKKLEEKYPETNLQHLLLSLTWFEDAQEDNSKLIMIKPTDWEDVKRFFEEF